MISSWFLVCSCFGCFAWRCWSWNAASIPLLLFSFVDHKSKDFAWTVPYTQDLRWNLVLLQANALPPALSLSLSIRDDLYNNVQLMCELVTQSNAAFTPNICRTVRQRGLLLSSVPVVERIKFLRMEGSAKTLIRSNNKETNPQGSEARNLSLKFDEMMTRFQ